MSSPIRAIGIPWYSQASYGRILEIMEDRDLLPATFEKWLYRAEQTRKQLLGRGTIVVKAQIEPDAFSAWCRDHGCGLNADGRNKFASFIAYQYALKGE